MVKILSCLFVLMTCKVFARPASPFDFPEPNVLSSPADPRSLKLEKGSVVIDLDVSSTAPVAAALVTTAKGHQKVILWNIDLLDRARALQTFAVPADAHLSSLVWHPQSQQLFFLASDTKGSKILQSSISGLNSWKPKVIYHTNASLRRLVFGPRPFSIEYDAEQKKEIIAYRLFFGVREANGTYSTHTITESGTKEYPVLDDKDRGSAPHDVEEAITTRSSSALPVGTHPAGTILIWENAQHCFQKILYDSQNWSVSESVIKGSDVCGGSLSYTPNGNALLHWKKDIKGVELLMDHGATKRVLIPDQQLLTAPSSVPDGRGLVGVTEGGLQYWPTDVPLADVTNAWMFEESPRDRVALSDNSGLFRELDKNQLYDLYDTESYHCGGYDSSTPSRPYLVTTDIFWELYASAFEGLFVLSEKHTAIPHFWNFVAAAASHLKAQPDRPVAKAFAAVLAVREGQKSNKEARLILEADGTSRSAVTGTEFNFGDLKPRGHYDLEPELQTYFRAMKYLTTLPLSDADIQALSQLPAIVQTEADNWIGVYRPFLAQPRGPTVWNPQETPGHFAGHPQIRPSLFPLSWGLDNEALDNATFHEDRPETEQITGAKGPRLLPSALDVAIILGSRLAQKIQSDAGTLQLYPNLQPQIQALQKRSAKSKQNVDTSLYSKWLSVLSTQWRTPKLPTDQTFATQFWERKRLQTGLAAWATLRHSTLLINARNAAECGEAGFEPIVLQAPRGYVEPDPATFRQIAELFDLTSVTVKKLGKSWAANEPGLQEGLLARLKESAEKVRLFAAIADKELHHQALSSEDYESILYVGRAAEHNFLIFKSLAQKDMALSDPDPLPKVAEISVAGAGSRSSFWLVGVGQPLEWDQIVPFFGRKEVVKGATYSFYETSSSQVLSDKEWRTKIKDLPRPTWVQDVLSPSKLSCPAKVP